MAADAHGRRALKRRMEEESRDSAFAHADARHSVSLFSFINYRALTTPFRRLAVIDEHVWIFIKFDHHPGAYFY